MTDSDGAAILQVTDLTKTFSQGRSIFGSGGEDVVAVSDVSLAVAEGRTLGLVGESGSGKSTLAKTIVGLHEPTSGTVEFRGEDVADMDSNDFHRSVQYVFQDPYGSLNPRQTVRKILDAPLRILAGMDGAQERRDRINELLDLIGLRREMADRYPHELSGGQAQRIGIARALSTTAEVLLLDEPVSALDVSIQAQILNLLSQLQDELGLTYVFISHDLAVVEGLCDDVAVMRRAELVETGPARDVYEDPSHEYTRTLLAAVPVPGERREERTATG